MIIFVLERYLFSDEKNSTKEKKKDFKPRENFSVAGHRYKTKNKNKNGIGSS